MKTLFIIISFLMSGHLMSQTVLLMHDVNKDVDTEEGPGKIHHQSGYLGFGAFVGPSENDSLGLHKNGSININYGYYSKWQPTRFFALGMLSGFDLNVYRLSQNNKKAYIVPFQVQKEHFWQLNYGIQPFMRLNYAIKRGDHHGIYTDFGAYFAYSVLSRHSYRVKDASTSESSKVISRRLDYVNRLQYGAVFKIGIRGLTLYGKYRLNDLFKENDDGFNPPDLPKFTVGLQIMG